MLTGGMRIQAGLQCKMYSANCHLRIIQKRSNDFAFCCFTTLPWLIGPRVQEQGEPKGSINQIFLTPCLAKNNLAMSKQTFDAFVALHSHQLVDQQVPECLWQQLFALLDAEAFTAGEHCELSRFVDEEGESDIENDGKLMCIATHDMDPDSVCV
jgi:hypothetical protein